MSISDRACQRVPKDIAEELGLAGIARLLQLMVDAYRDLKARKCIAADSSEDSITEEWFVHIQQRWRNEPAIALVPVHQKADATEAKSRGRHPTVDFCFRDSYEARSYFGVECKLLDEGNTRHLGDYLDDTRGIGRFLRRRYAAYAGAGAMAGYVRIGSPNHVAEILKTALANVTDKVILARSGLLPGAPHLYESRHRRDRARAVAAFLCYHLLLAFECGVG